MKFLLQDWKENRFDLVQKPIGYPESTRGKEIRQKIEEARKSKAMIDLRNLSELLAEEADVTDAPDAMDLPEYNETDSDIAVEFDNVFFHYPTQPDTKGLKGVSFKMKKGTTTAIVGTTGGECIYLLRLWIAY